MMDREKRKTHRDAKKFLKVYMFTLLGVVLVLIIASYFSQDKLNEEIERLNVLVDTHEEVAVQSTSKIESMQKLSEEQEKLLAIQEKSLAELEDADKIASALDIFWKLQRSYYLDEYEKSLSYVDMMDSSGNFENLPDEAQIEYDLIKEDLIIRGNLKEQEEIENQEDTTEEIGE